MEETIELTNKKIGKIEIAELIYDFKKMESKKFVASIFDEGVWHFVNNNILGEFNDLHTIKLEIHNYLVNVLRNLDRNGRLFEQLEIDDSEDKKASDKIGVLKGDAINCVIGILPRCFEVEVND